MSTTYRKIINNVDQALHQPGMISDLALKLEKCTGVRRIYMAQGLFALFALYMIFGYFAQLVCNFVGFLYPAYVSIKALESSSKEDDTRWLTYWVVFAFFSVIEFFSDSIFSWFPFYWLAKVFFLVWCYLPIKENGTNYIYQRIIRPAFIKNTSKIDNFAKRIINEAKDTITKHD